MPFIAEYAGTCSACDEPIEPGQMIVADTLAESVASHYRHVDCEPRPDRPREVCTTCFLQRPCECDDAA